MPNHLANSNSPYLLQHQDNPVDWYPWGEEALTKAKDEDKPIFLSIGYAACHWCHVMAHESFEDEATAALMNEHFVNIKVDREERPDIDAIYMSAVVTLTGSGGWPMSVFLTPQGEPFIGGTYFPPVARHNLPSFTELLRHVQRLWSEERDKVFEAGKVLLEHMQASELALAGADSLKQEALDQAAMRLAQSYDWNNGGWGGAPKFPQPMTIDFLLGRGLLGDKMARDVALHALKAMSKGGMYDVVGGGFARYSVETTWLVPHFEKMLYDNAQLARTYLHGYLVSGDEALKRVCERTLDFVAREMRDKSGAFYSSLDADSEGEEGKFYVWAFDEIQAHTSELFIAAFGVKPEGNFEGKTILQRTLSDEHLAEQFDMVQAAVRNQLDRDLAQLLAARDKRVRPQTDDKALTAWNAMMLTTFAEAARYLNRADYLEIAQANADFMLSELQQGDRLLRAWRAGNAALNAYLEDYAALILGLLALYQSDADPCWYAQAERLADEMLAHFSDPTGGFFDTSDQHEVLITHPKEIQDNATPSGNSLAAMALLQLAAYSGKGEWFDLATKSAAALQDAASKYPTAFGQWLQALQFAQAEVKEIAVVGEEGKRQDFLNVVWAEWQPFAVVAASTFPPSEKSPALLQNRSLVNGEASAYVCRNFVCERPVTEPMELKVLLD